MRYVVTTPAPRWTGEVAGVAFAHGTGVTDEDPPARVLNYFRRRGYGVTPIQVASEAADEAAPDGTASVEADKKPASRRGGTTSKETP